MAIYILNSNLTDSKELKNLLKKQYEDVYTITLKSLMLESGISHLKPNSILLIKDHFHSKLMKEAISYCGQHKIPLLAIVQKDSFATETDFLFSEEILLDVVTDPTESELYLRVKIFLNYQKEKAERRAKENILNNTLNHMTDELNFAKKLQQLVLPKDFTDENIKFRAIYEPSAQLSGDLYYWIKISDDEYGMILIDVSGTGVHAALVSMGMRFLFPGLLRRVKDPSLIANELNQHMLSLFDKLEGNSFVTSYFTAIILKINTKEKYISMVNAGHQPFFLLENGQITTLESTMVPIGLIAKPEIKQEVIRYSSETKLLLFTDGLIEIPFCSRENRLQKVKSDFLQLATADEESILQSLMNKRKEASHLLDDICAVSITLY